MAAAVEPALPAAILPSLRDGTFPNSDDLLLTELSQDLLPSILDTVSNAKKELSDEIGAIFREQGKDVDDWIAQAKRVQAEIARCKDVAREIVKEHEKARSMHAAVQDAQAKVHLLQEEIKFSSSILEEFEKAGTLSRDLDTVQASLASGGMIEAATRLQKLKTSFANSRPSRATDLLNTRRERLVSDAHTRLEEAFDNMIRFGKTDGASWVEITSLTEGTSLSLDATLQAFQNLETLHKITNKLTARLDEFIFHPLLRKSPQTHSIAAAQGGRLSLEAGPRQDQVQSVLESSRTTIQYVHTNLPEALRLPVVAVLLPGFVSRLIRDWLMPAVPFDLADVACLQALQEQAKTIADLLVSFNWPCHQEFLEWIEQSPLMWLERRKMTSLFGVRKALATPRGPVREVERVETETVSKEEATGTVGNGGSKLSSKPSTSQTEDDEDEASGWDFDADDNLEENLESATKEDDTEDAWGWGDEDNTEKPSTQKESANGLHDQSPQGNKMTLVETYTITDIPDYILEIIGRDIMDAQTVKDPQFAALHSAYPTEGLMAIPSSVLAMFRAIAPTYYTSALPSGNMHLYNDSMYIVQRLREATVRTDAIDANCRVVEKFGRSAYAREMDIQRTILRDLLDGAQGFVRCTQAPNLNECEIAVTSCVDRLRAIHAEWRSVLSQSALMQATGSLLSTVLAKIIQDIEDMDDISEPESKRLTSFCNQLTALEDLFIPKDQEEAVTTVIIYVATWLKLQYLINILEASLVDIRYMWIEGELSLEFTADEVVDLIKALFAESTHRRGAIAAIKSHVREASM